MWCSWHLQSFADFKFLPDIFHATYTSYITTLKTTQHNTTRNNRNILGKIFNKMKQLLYYDDYNPPRPLNLDQKPFSKHEGRRQPARVRSPCTYIHFIRTLQVR